MPSVTGHKISIKGKIINREGRLWFYAEANEFFLMPGVIKQINQEFDSLEGEITGIISFEAKIKKGARTISLKASEDLIPKEIKLDIPSMNLLVEGINIVPVQSAIFQQVLVDAITSELNSEIFDELFEQERIPWSDNEELVALEIYVESKGQDYGSMLNLIDKAIINGQITRSKDAVEMKVNCYKALDSDSGVGGLGNTSSKTIQLWNDYKMAQSKKTNSSD